jgi:uncharacterized membrane protein
MKDFIIAASMLMLLLALQAFAIAEDVAANNSINVTVTNETLSNATLSNETIGNETLENVTFINDTMESSIAAQNDTNPFADAKNVRPHRK